MERRLAARARSYVAHACGPARFCSQASLSVAFALLTNWLVIGDLSSSDLEHWLRRSIMYFYNAFTGGNVPLAKCHGPGCSKPD